METLVRGYINDSSSQQSFYFEKTDENIANFILEYARPDNEIVIDTIFGKLVLAYHLENDELTGKEYRTSGVRICLEQLRTGILEPKRVMAINLEDVNDADQIDNIEVEEKEYESFI